jgi:predicted alpha/beta hydrolase
MRDWGYTARHGRFPRLDGFDGPDVNAAVATIRTPVLAISVDHDQFTPAPTTDHLVAKLRAAPVERVHLTAAEAGAPLDHFAWVRASAPIARRVAAFAAAPT